VIPVTLGRDSSRGASWKQPGSTNIHSVARRPTMILCNKAKRLREAGALAHRQNIAIDSRMAKRQNSVLCCRCTINSRLLGARVWNKATGGS
jgi:hypothetical protein